MILLCLIWYFVGAYSFYYWWTNDHHLTSAEIPLLLFAGFTGPVAFFMGMYLHGDKTKPIFKKREKK